MAKSVYKPVDILLMDNTLKICTKYIPKSPVLFSQQCAMRLETPDRKCILRMHEDILNHVRSSLKDAGAPELRPIKARALKESAYKGLLKERSGISSPNTIFLGSEAFCTTKITEGHLAWDLFYNIQAAVNRGRNNKPFGELVVHEILGTLLGGLYEAYQASLGQEHSTGNVDVRGQSESIKRITILNEGWGMLFSQTPLTAVDLHRLEYEASQDPDLQSERADILKNVFADRHVFPALVFLKTEMAFGFERLIGLMHYPPGLIMEKKGPAFHDIMGSLVRTYRDANAELGVASVSVEYLPKKIKLI